MDVKQFCPSQANVGDAARSLAFKARFARDNPAYFYPDGIWVFCGAQGSGKTLSAVRTAKLMARSYPMARVISNLDVKGLDSEPFEAYEQLETEHNGTNGLIFLLDEIHVLWNSLESKNIPISEMATFCQMRKERRIILGTSQVYGRIAKPIREQLKYIIDCRNFFGLLQFNNVLDPSQSVESDGHISAPLIKHEFFFHSPELYTSYETLNKIGTLSREPNRLDGAHYVSTRR